MKTIFISLALVGAFLTGPLFAKDKPNILFFLVDDMGVGDTSVPFFYEDGKQKRIPTNDLYRTPHMEELAKNAGWTQKVCDENLELLEKFWLNSLNDGSLIRNNGRYFLSNPKGMQISNQILIQMFLWWDSLGLY